MWRRLEGLESVVSHRVPVEKPGSREHGRENITQARRSLRCKIISGLDLRTPWGGAYIGRERLRLQESLVSGPEDQGLQGLHPPLESRFLTLWSSVA